MKTLLIPLDGSELATQIVPYARSLAAMLSARIHLIHVVADYPGKNVLAGFSSSWQAGDVPVNGWKHDEETFTRLRQQGEDLLNETAQALRDDGLDVDIDVHFGAPANCIVQTAKQIHASLIAMVTHGYSGLRRWTLGSTTDKVVHSAETPVFIVRGNSRAAPIAPTDIKRILVPLDCSAFARQALPIAAELATHAHASLHLLHAVQPPDNYPALVRASVSDQVFATAMERTRTWAEQELATCAADLRRQELQTSTRVAVGYPAEVVLDESRASQSDLIVMATHGYSGLQRWALGSVSDKVLHAATTPLILVRAREE